MKALMIGTEGQTLTSGEEGQFGGQCNTTVEANHRWPVFETLTLSGMKARVASGNSGTATFRLRDTAANGNQTFAITGAAGNDAAALTDTLTSGDDFNWSYTDTGTDSVVDYVACNIEFAGKHGCYHAASNTLQQNIDFPNATRYQPISGLLEADGASEIADAQWRNTGYDEIAAFSIRVNNNARVNDTIFRINVNGVSVGTAITFAAAETGRKNASALGIVLREDDLVCLEHTLGAGTEDMDLESIVVVLKSSSTESALIWGRPLQSNARAASATPNFYMPGGSNALETTEADEQVSLGFNGSLSFLQIYVPANTYTAAATWSLRVNGVDRIIVTIPAATTGWFRNPVDRINVLSTDLISFGLVGGTSGSLTPQCYSVKVSPPMTSGIAPSSGIGGGGGVSGIGGQSFSRYANITQVA